MNRTRIVTVVLAAYLAAGAAGCAAFVPELPVQPPQNIAARPSIEEVTRRYDEMQNRIKQVINVESGPRTWQESVPARSSPCGNESDDIRAGKETMPLYSFDGGITDEQWRRIAPAAVAIIREYGFSTEGVLAIDKPGYHQLGGKDTYGAYFEMGSQVNTDMQVRTNCHYPQAVLDTLTR